MGGHLPGTPADRAVSERLMPEIPDCSGSLLVWGHEAHWQLALVDAGRAFAADGDDKQVPDLAGRGAGKLADRCRIRNVRARDVRSDRLLDRYPRRKADVDDHVPPRRCFDVEAYQPESRQYRLFTFLNTALQASVRR